MYDKFAIAYIPGTILLMYVVVRRTIDIHKTEEAKRTQIRKDAERKIAAIEFAGLIVEQDISDGHYDEYIKDGTILDKIAADFELYKKAFLES